MRNVFDLIEKTEDNRYIKILQDWIRTSGSSMRQSLTMSQNDFPINSEVRGFIPNGWDGEETLGAIKYLYEKGKKFDVTIMASDWAAETITLKNTKINSLSTEVGHHDLAVTVSLTITAEEVIRKTNEHISTPPYYTIPQTMEWGIDAMVGDNESLPIQNDWTTNVATMPADGSATISAATAPSVRTISVGTGIGADGYATLNGNMYAASAVDELIELSRAPQHGDIRYNQNSRVTEFYSTENRWIPIELPSAASTFIHTPVTDEIVGTLN